MRVSIFGLGYVGSVSAASFASDGHEVVGVDVDADKVRAINEGRSPIVEPDLPNLLRDAVRARRLRATVDPAEAVAATDLSLVCVGTPSRRNGSLDLTYLTRACQHIGEALRAQDLVPRRGHSKHRTAGDDARLPHSGDRGRVRQAVRRGLRSLGQSRVPARGDGTEGLSRAADDAGRA